MSQANVNLSFNIPGLYRSIPTGFQATVNGQNGPTPGAIKATTAGVDVNLSELVALGGFCWLTNYGTVPGDTDPAHRVDWGIFEVSGSKFWPLGSILPGECYLIRLSPELGWDEAGTGTGTGAAVSTFRLRSNVGVCQCRVDAFEP